MSARHGVRHRGGKLPMREEKELLYRSWHSRDVQQGVRMLRDLLARRLRGDLGVDDAMVNAVAARTLMHLILAMGDTLRQGNG